MTDDRPARLDRATFDALYRRLERSLYNVVYRWVWSSEDAHEIVQEAFVRLWDMRARVRMDSVEPLVYRIAVNLASKRRRWKKRWDWLQRAPSPTLASAEHRADDALVRAVDDARVRAAVESLPEHERAVVMLVNFSELSYAQVAEALQIAPGTVGSRRNAALRRLRTALEEDHARAR